MNYIDKHFKFFRKNLYDSLHWYTSCKLAFYKYFYYICKINGNNYER